MARLEKYILRQLMSPFLLGVFVVTFLLSMDFLFDSLNLFLGKGIGFFVVLRLFFLGLGWMLALSIPCGALVAVLMAYGRMAQDSEIIAMKASGISPLRAIRPALIASIILSILLVLFHNNVLPDMNHAFANLMMQVHKTRPTAHIQEGVFIDDFKGYNLFIGNLDDKTGRMEDVLIYDYSRKNDPARTILAKRGTLTFDAASGVLSLNLLDGEIHQAGAGRSSTYRKLDFEKQILNITGARESIDRGRERARGQREMSIAAMREKVRDLEEERDRYLGKQASALEKIGIASVYEIRGVKRKLAWHERAAGAIGLWRAPVIAARPDTFWTPQRQRMAEDAKLARVQAAAATKKVNQYRVEIHKKYSIPFACIVFALVGAPLGIRARRGGLAAGFISVGFFIFYYLCLIGGEQLADRNIGAPWFSMWLPNLVLGALGLWLALRVCQIRLPWRRGAAPITEEASRVC